MFRFADTASLDRTALSCAAAGAACVAVGSLVTPDPTWALRLAGPALLTVAAARGGWRARLGALGFGVAATAVQLVWSGYPVFAQAAAGAWIGGALAWLANRMRVRGGGEGAPWYLLAATVAFAAVAWPLAVGAMRAVALSELALVMPPLVLSAVAGGVFGLLIGLTQAPSHLVRTGDVVLEALQKARTTLDGELRDLVMRIVEARQRALRLLERSRAEGHARRETLRGLDGVAMTAIDLTDRFSAVDRVLSRTPRQSVEERITLLKEQLAASQDPGTRRDLERAVANLDEQRAQIDRLLQGRTRLLARLESELASLERTEMALALLASGDAAMSGIKLEAIGSSLGRQAQELEAEGTALQEALTVAPAYALQRFAAAAGGAAESLPAAPTADRKRA